MMKVIPYPGDKHGSHHIKHMNKKSSDSEEQYPCPCCGYLVFTAIGSYEFCPICKWQDDLAQLRFVTLPGGANPISLYDAQKNYITTGISVSRRTGVAFEAHGTYEKDPFFRAIDLDRDNIEMLVEDVEYGTTYPKPRSLLYYWRDTYWRKSLAQENSDPF